MTEDLEILEGDCRAVLPTIEAESVQCCVTSPPYWGLRDYGTSQWEGGAPECDHKRFNGYASGLEGSKESTFNGKFEKLICGKCGARRIDSQTHFATFPEEIPKLCILAGTKPGDTILDPFAGSGTVGKVALELGRRAVLIELNPNYLEMARERTFVTPGFF